MFLSPFSIAPFGFVQCKWPGLVEQVSLFSRLWHVSRVLPQALVSFKKYMPPPLPYFKVNICPFPLPHFASIFFAYLWSFRWPNYIVTLPRYFSFRLPHLNIPTARPLPLRRIWVVSPRRWLVKVVTRARVRFQKPGPKFVFSLLHLY